MGYATEGALFISAQLSTDAVSALRKVWILITPKHARIHETHPPRAKKKKKKKREREKKGWFYLCRHTRRGQL